MNKIMKLITSGSICFVLFMTTACADSFEKRLREKFDKNFDVLQKLEQMQRKDIKTYYITDEINIQISKNHSRLNNTLSIERWNEYRKLLRQADIEVLGYNFTKPTRTVRFGDIGDNSEGFIYIEELPQKTFNSLKECIEARNKDLYNDTCYVYLRKHWYMYQDR